MIMPLRDRPPAAKPSRSAKAITIGISSTTRLKVDGIKNPSTMLTRMMAPITRR